MCVHICMCVHVCGLISLTRYLCVVYVELQPPWDQLLFLLDTAFSVCLVSSICSWFVLITSLAYMLPYDLHSASAPTPTGT